MSLPMLTSLAVAGCGLVVKMLDSIDNHQKICQKEIEKNEQKMEENKQKIEENNQKMEEVKIKAKKREQKLNMEIKMKMKRMDIDIEDIDDMDMNMLKRKIEEKFRNKKKLETLNNLESKVRQIIIDQFKIQREVISKKEESNKSI